MLDYLVYLLTFSILIGLFFFAIKKAELTTRNMILVALFASLTAIGAYIKIPIPYVPFTLQVFFCIYAGVLLGAELGMMSQLIYVLVGLSGVPVFTQGGGPGYIFQPTFGYLVGFIIGAYVTGKVLKYLSFKNIYGIFISCMAGLIAIYIIGVPYLFLIKNIYLGANTFTFYMALLYGFLLTIGGDLISIMVVSASATKLLPLLKRNKLLPWVKNI